MNPTHPSVLPSPSWTDADWETLWAPYSEDTYREVLAALDPQDIVLDIGAGDLRLATRMAAKVRHVYALEIQTFLIENALFLGQSLPPRLSLIQADARTHPFPTGITAAVLLMRHCTHFRLYADKLKAVGCQKLITNARWRMGVEVLHLQPPRQEFAQTTLGWYACWCGNTGFKPGPVENLTEEIFNTTYEVACCPECISVRSTAR